ncbi:MAG: hypothetical protein JSC189_000406 [Candidatus Tokpelaia sp. JSC189]|nr:MAG: hypothetical protein JSC189_000406 [Candidatus Tokpelaia sp. JSC189]
MELLPSTLQVPNNSVMILCIMGEITVLAKTASNPGDLVYFNNTTGELAFSAPTAAAPDGLTLNPDSRYARIHRRKPGRYPYHRAITGYTCGLLAAVALKSRPRHKDYCLFRCTQKWIIQILWLLPCSAICRCEQKISQDRQQRSCRTQGQEKVRPYHTKKLAMALSSLKSC